MTSKLDRRYTALVEVCNTGFMPISTLMLCIHKTWAVLDSIVCLAGSGMWFGGNRRATGCHANTIGILPHGVWLLQTISIQC